VLNRTDDLRIAKVQNSEWEIWYDHIVHSRQRCSVLLKDDVKPGSRTLLASSVLSPQNILRCLTTRKPNHNSASKPPHTYNRTTCDQYVLPPHAACAYQTHPNPPRHSAPAKPHHASSARIAHNHNPSPNNGASSQIAPRRTSAKSHSKHNPSPNKPPTKHTTLSSPMRSPRGPHQTRLSQSTSQPSSANSCSSKPAHIPTCTRNPTKSAPKPCHHG
jgi:hypothetical protein